VGKGAITEFFLPVEFLGLKLRNVKIEERNSASAKEKVRSTRRTNTTSSPAAESPAPKNRRAHQHFRCAIERQQTLDYGQGIKKGEGR